MGASSSRPKYGSAVLPGAKYLLGLANRKVAQPNFSLLKQPKTPKGEGGDTAPSYPPSEDHPISTTSGGNRGIDAAVVESSHRDLFDSPTPTQTESGTKPGTNAANGSRQGERPNLPLSEPREAPELGEQTRNVSETRETASPQTLYDIYHNINQSSGHIAMGIAQEDATHELLRSMEDVIESHVNGHPDCNHIDQGTPPQDPGVQDATQEVPAAAYDEMFGLNLDDSCDLNEPQTEHGVDEIPARKIKRTAITLGALNIGGLGTTTNFNDPRRSKWYHLNQVMKDKELAAVIIGEAHLNAERHDRLDRLFGRQLTIKFSEYPENPNAKGVAIVLNKSFFKSEESDVKSWEIVPGHAILVETRWGNKKLSILGVYAPNEHARNQQMTEQITEFFRRRPNIRKPDILAGDFNLVEEAIDRFPMRRDPTGPVDALDTLKSELLLIDGWRETYPKSLAYTFHQKQTGSASRIDRIYVKHNLFESTFDWKIKHSVGVETDHSMVTVKLTNEDLPEKGNGRWVWPAYINQDKELAIFILETGLELLRQMNACKDPETRTETFNPQVIWEQWQTKVREKARERAKILIPRQKREIAALESKLELVTNDRTMSDEERALSSAVLVEKIKMLELKRHTQARDSTAARNRLEGEVISKYWSQLNKERKPREVIARLNRNATSETNNGVVTGNETDTPYITDSQCMADLACSYHNGIQFRDKPVSPADIETRDNAIKEILESVNTDLPGENAEDLARHLLREDIIEALKLSANGKAPGLNGITYEVYKSWHSRFETATKKGQPAFDIIGALLILYNDIEAYGKVKGTTFTESWMAPLYKKGDKAEIANYRPISLLNTDYKIFTKALSIKLARAAPKIIHPNQAGFIPGRQIYDHIWLAKRVLEYAEAVEEDGAIVALDQEKAYDRIEHGYLWETMAKYNIPNQFINTVRSLYEDAHTFVMINGVKSQKSFKVVRGVRQGDPLSCLLFDIAIEPLAEALRKSDLHGLRIPGTTGDRLIATLFADDTTVYLSKLDDWRDLKSVLDKWCKASGAKFNIHKTEVIPIGKPTFRESVLLHRTIDGTVDSTPFDDHVKMVKDGEATRILGGWIGNNVDQVAVWSKTLEKIDTTLDRWEKGHPTMEGRRLIIQMVVAGMTQYLTKVQGMPEEIEKLLEKRIHSFMWGGRTARTINKETMYADLDEGGKKVFDISARNEAIMITWIQAYLRLNGDRPIWGFFADRQMALAIASDDDCVDPTQRENPYLQSWRPIPDRLPADLRKMVKTAKKYGVEINGLAFDRKIIRNMPIWYHTKCTKTRGIYSDRIEANTCLKHQHFMKTVGEAEELTKIRLYRKHKRQPKCPCKLCQKTRRLTGCTNPDRCAQRAESLLNALPRKWNPLCHQPQDYESDKPPEPERDGDTGSAFKPTITTKGSLADVFRIFAEPSDSEQPPDTELYCPDDTPAVNVYTDGSCTNNGLEDSESGAGVFMERAGIEGEDLVRMIKVPMELGTSNNTGELVAIKEVLESLPGRDLVIHSDSKYAIEGLTKHLEKWEDRGYIGVENAHLIEVSAARLRARKTNTLFKWVKGHAGIDGNEKADKLAGLGRQKRRPDLINMVIPPELRITGAKLSKITQAFAYQGIKDIKTHTYKYQEARDRTMTERNMAKAKQSSKNIARKTPSEKQIWGSLRNKAVSRNIRNFLFLLMHGGYRIGNFWKNIAGYEHRATCMFCNETESVKHIFLECRAPGRSQTWRMARELWASTGREWPEISVGTILACAQIKFTNDEGRSIPGVSRFFQIVISESAFFIWKLRNQRVINEENPPSAREIENRWIYTINSRRKLDWLMTDETKYKAKALPKKLVRDTWKTVSTDTFDDLRTASRQRGAGVLVGMG